MKTNNDDDTIHHYTLRPQHPSVPFPPTRRCTPPPPTHSPRHLVSKIRAISFVSIVPFVHRVLLLSALFLFSFTYDRHRLFVFEVNKTNRVCWPHTLNVSDNHTSIETIKIDNDAYWKKFCNPVRLSSIYLLTAESIITPLTFQASRTCGTSPTAIRQTHRGLGTKDWLANFAVTTWKTKIKEHTHRNHNHWNYLTTQQLTPIPVFSYHQSKLVPIIVFDWKFKTV